MNKPTLEQIEEELKFFNSMTGRQKEAYKIVTYALTLAKKLAFIEAGRIVCNECNGNKTISVFEPLKFKFVKKPCACCFTGLEFKIWQAENVTNNKYLNILKQFNCWRRDNSEMPERQIKMPCPKDIGLAIEKAIEIMEAQTND